MKVIYIKDFVGHVEGHVIDTDPTTAKFLVENKKVCEYVKDEPKGVGNPNWKKNKKQ